MACNISNLAICWLADDDLRIPVSNRTNELLVTAKFEKLTNPKPPRTDDQKKTIVRWPLDIPENIPVVHGSKDCQKQLYNTSIIVH